MKTFDEIVDVLKNVKYPNYEIRLRKDENRLYLQIFCHDDICNVTGEKLSWSGRKWMLSYHMTVSEIVRTAYKAVEAAVLHEMNEKFKYKDVAIHDPHLDVEFLVACEINNHLDVRN